MTPIQIVILVAVIVGLILLMRLIQPKLTPAEKYLLHVIQRKSPQTDNIRLYMWIKMIVHPIRQATDLAAENDYLDDLEQYKMLIEQFYGFGPNVFYPLLGYEAIQWHLDANEPDPLVARLIASQVVRRFPHSAAVIEDLVFKSPDAHTEQYIEKHPQEMPERGFLQERYYYLIEGGMKIIVHTVRNDWWPGVSPDIREWAESILAKMEQKRLAKSR